MRALTSALQQFQKPPMSLKQFMLRAEVLKLYRGFMKLSRLMVTPPSTSSCCAKSHSENSVDDGKPIRSLDPLQVEWINWVRAEFRLRQTTDDEEAIKMMLAHGKRQLQEIERTILLATNRNSKEKSETWITNDFKRDRNSSCSKTE